MSVPLPLVTEPLGLSPEPGFPPEFCTVIHPPFPCPTLPPEAIVMAHALQTCRVVSRSRPGKCGMQDVNYAEAVQRREGAFAPWPPPEWPSSVPPYEE